MSKKEKEAESELIKRGYAQIREKVKEIRQSFSQAVVNRKRSGCGKIVFEFYDELIRIWGGSTAIQPLSFGVDTETLNYLNSSQNTQLQQTLLSNDDEVLGLDGTETDEICTAAEQLSAEESQSLDGRKRKSVNPVSKLIDKRKKLLEKTLPAAQRDALLLTEAKEESKF